MIDLYIDGTAVVLPAEFSTEIKRENSFFTKAGEYTYDIKLSLNNPINSGVYAQYLRVNSHTRITEPRQAILIMDNQVLLQGIEIITEWDEESVSIQLASGNSQLNYLIGADLKIKDLQMDTFDRTDPVYSETIGNPDYYAAIALPVYNLAGKNIINEWQLVDKDPTDSISAKCELKPGTQRSPQPFLRYYVWAVLQALGYQVGTLQLNEPPYNRLVMLHDRDTNKFSEMFPEWTVKDFFECVECLLNIVLVVNNRAKQVDVVFANRFYLSRDQVFLEVEDDYTVEVDDEPEPTMATGNITYELPSSQYFKGTRLSDDIENLCKRVSTSGGYKGAQEYFTRTKENRTIAVDSNTGREYIYAIDPESPYVQARVMEVNQYADLDRNAEEISLKMIPAEMAFPHLTYLKGTEELLTKGVPMPAVAGAATSDVSDKPLSIQDMIEKSAPKDTSNSSYIPMAFYFGKNKQSFGDVQLPGAVPYSAPDTIVQNGYAYPCVLETNTRYSLRLPILDREVYTGTYEVDTKHKYTFWSDDPNTPDPRCIFVIRNKRFVCREMVWTIAKGEKMKRWKIVCHPIAISDTEAMKRWVLDDGHWRSGGLWLEDGRWNPGE